MSDGKLQVNVHLPHDEEPANRFCCRLFMLTSYKHLNFAILSSLVKFCLQCYLAFPRLSCGSLDESDSDESDPSVAIYLHNQSDEILSLLFSMWSRQGDCQKESLLFFSSTCPNLYHPRTAAHNWFHMVQKASLGKHLAAHWCLYIQTRPVRHGRY